MTKKLVACMLTLLMVFAVAVSAEDGADKSVMTDGVFSYYIIDGKAVITDCADSESETIEIPKRLGGKSVSDISGGAFSQCKNAKSFVTDNRSFYTIEGVLYGDDTLICYPQAKAREYFNVPDGIKHIENGAFFGNANLESVSLPEKLETLGTEVFAGCKNLESVTGGEGITKIGAGTFAFCGKLTNYDIPESVTEIGDAAFYDCVSYSEIELGDNIIYIGKLAFRNCEKISEIHIPDNASDVSGWLFSIGEKLEKITVSEKNKYYTVQDGILFSKDKSVLLFCPKPLKIGKYILPEETAEIGEGAFEGCGGITEAVMGDGLRKIGDRAFYNAKSLESVSFGGTEEIGQYAFFGCDSLEDVTVTAKVASIGEGAFEECEKIMLHIASGSACYFHAVKNNIPYKEDPSQEEIPIPHWADEYRKWGIEKKIVIPETPFDAALTYEGFCWMIVNMYEELRGVVELPSQNPFYDTKSHGVLKAYALGFAQPMWETRFGSERLIQRQEICTYLHHFLTKVNGDRIEKGRDNIFRDSSDIADWAKVYVNAAYNNGIISGLPDGRINPKGYATIDQTLAMLYNMSKLIK